MTAAEQPSWIPIKAVIAYNKEVVERSGEAHQLRDCTALQRALAHPEGQFRKAPPVSNAW